MAKKNFKILGKKALSLLLTLTMVTSLLQVSAFAAPGNWTYAYYLGQEYLGNAPGKEVKPDPVGYGFQGVIDEITFEDDNGKEWTFRWSHVDNGEWRITGGNVSRDTASAWPDITQNKEYIGTCGNDEYRFYLTDDGKAAGWTYANTSNRHANWFMYIRFIREYTVNVFYQNETGEVVYDEVTYTAELPLVRDFEFKYPNGNIIDDSEFEDGDYTDPVTLLPADYLSDEMKAQGYEIHAATDGDGNDVMNSGVTISLFGDNVLNVYCTLKAPETDTYKVVHEYYTNEELDDKVNDELTIEQGTEINAELIEGLKQPVNNEITYEFTSYDVDPATKTITLVYKRTYIPPAPILGIEKRADKSSAMAGEVVNYTITVSNTGNASATNVVVTDTPDANLIVDAENLAEGGYDAEAGTITWTVAEIAAGASWSVTIPMTLTAAEGDTEAINAAAIEDGDEDEETVSFLGSLEITKAVSGASVPETATFTVTGEGFTKTVSYSEFEDGKYVLNDLALGTYTVTESGAEIEGYELTVNGSGAEIEVGAAETAKVTITNTYEKIVPPTGSLKITKTTSGNTTPAGATFTITGPEGYEKVVTFAKFVDGVYEISELALGEYSVVESNADIDGYDLVVTGTKVASIEAKGDVAEIELHNEYTKQPPKVGSLRIHKTAEGATVPAEAVFTITGKGYSASVSYAEFDEIGYYQITGLNPGTYTVAESGAEIDGYALTVSGDKEAVVVAGSTADLAIVNTYVEKTGYLTINKTIVGLAEGLDIPATTKFNIVNYNARPGMNPLVKTVYWSEFENGSITIELPEGEYTVVETLGSAIVSGYDIPSRVAKYTNEEYAVVPFGGTDVVNYTNIYKVTYVPQPNVNITKEADVATAKVGDIINYTITVTNSGDATATNLTIVDTPDANLEIISVDGGEYTDGQITWKLGTLAKDGGSESFTVSAKVKKTSATEVTNTVIVTDEKGGSDSDTEIVTLKASLKIKKRISGLDEQSLSKVEQNLVFTITDPNGESKDYSYAEDFFRGELEIEDPIPGTYTIVEKNAEVTGYELDNGKGAWEVEVKAGGSAKTLNITNKYTGKIYNIWFDGGNHGDVRDDNGNAVSGVWRNLWTGIEESYEWAGFGLKDGWKVYQLGNSDTNNLYANLTENPEIAEGSSMVLYHFSWADWMDHKNDMGEGKPSLAVEEGWKSDREFYLDGGETAFTSFEAAVEYMNANPEATVDANGFYNAYFVAVYENDPVEPPYVPPYNPPAGGGGNGGDAFTPDNDEPVIEIPEEEVPLAPAPVEEPIVEIPDEEVPLAEVPKTGDESFRFILMALASALGLAALAVTKKREEDEMA